MKGTAPALRRLNPVQRYGVRLSLLGLAIVLVVVPFSTLLFQVLAKGAFTRLDGRVAIRLNQWVGGDPRAVSALKVVTDLGSPLLLVGLVLIAMFFVARRGSRRLTAFLAVTPLGGAIVDTLVKIAVNRPRPVVDNPVATAIGKSFPSGHAMSSMVTYGSLLLALLPSVARSRRPMVVFGTAVLIAAVGTSRLFLGVHYVTDVLGGWILGLAWLIGAVAVFEAWRTDEGRPVSSPLEEGVEPEAESALG